MLLKRIAKTTILSLLHDVQRLFGLDPVGRNGIYILMYHRICEERYEPEIALSADFFEQQMRYLRERYQVISLEQALDRLGTEPDRPLFVVTFDDGYRDNLLTAYPILRRYEVPATIFITCDHIESGVTSWHRMDKAIRRTSLQALDLTSAGLAGFPLSNHFERRQAIRSLHRLLKRLEDGRRLEIMREIGERCGAVPDERIMLNWDEVRDLAAGGLVTIGSHTLSHPILTRISTERASREIGESRKLIEARIGRPVLHFSYPNGQPDDISSDVVDLVRQSGYRSACTTLPGRNDRRSDPLALRRLDVTYGLCESFTGRFSNRMFVIGLAAEAAKGEDYLAAHAPRPEPC